MSFWDDHIAPVMTGATAGTAGRKGMAPAPAAGDQDKQLHGDGTWRTSTSSSASSSLEAAAGISTTKYVSPATAYLAAAPVSNRRATEGAVVFKAVSGSRITGTATGQSFAASQAVCLSIKAEVPAANPSGNRGIMGLSDTAGNNVRPGSLCAFVNSSGSLVVQFYGATVNDFRQLATAFVGAYPTGSMPLIHWDVRAGKLYINSVDTAAAESTGGSPPAWSAAVTGSIYNIGLAGSSEIWSGTLSKFALWNAQPDATDRLVCYLLGGTPPHWLQWGNQVAEYTSDFSAGLDNWNAAGGSTHTVTGNVDTNADGAGKPPSNDWQKAVTTVASTLSFYRNNALNSPGKRYKIVGDIFLPSGSALTTASLKTEQTALSSNVALTAGAVTSCTWEGVVPVTDDGNIYIQLTPAAGAAGVTAYLKNVIATRTGAVVFLPMDEGIGYQAHDLGNKFDGVLSATGLEHLIAKREGYVRTPGAGLTWTATHEGKSILGIAQRALPDGAVPTLSTSKSSAASAGSGLSIGTSNSATRWSALAAYSSNVKKINTLANQLPASTADADNDILYDPDSVNFTGTIVGEVHYKLTEGT